MIDPKDVGLENPDERLGRIAGEVFAQEAVDAAFAGRFIGGTKVPSTERHLTRDQLYRIIHDAVAKAVRKVQR